MFFASFCIIYFYNRGRGHLGGSSLSFLRGELFDFYFLESRGVFNQKFLKIVIFFLPFSLLFFLFDFLFWGGCVKGEAPPSVRGIFQLLNLTKIYFKNFYRFQYSCLISSRGHLGRSSPFSKSELFSFCFLEAQGV